MSISLSEGEASCPASSRMFPGDRDRDRDGSGARGAGHGRGARALTLLHVVVAEDDRRGGGLQQLPGEGAELGVSPRPSPATARALS